jgi:hypothetical protein
MSNGYDINQGEYYRNIWMHLLVRVTKVSWHEGITGGAAFRGRILPCTELPRYRCVSGFDRRKLFRAMSVRCPSAKCCLGATDK